MTREFKAMLPNGTNIEVRENAFDRAINFIAPNIAEERFKSRVRMAIGGSYYGGSTTRVGLRDYMPRRTDPDSNIFFDIYTLINRSRDAIRNNPIGGGAINTVCTKTVGRGITVDPMVDQEVLGMTDDEAEAWEAITEREFALWALSKDATLDRSMNFYESQDMALRSPLENGDVFVLNPYRKRSTPYGIALQFIEADRVCNQYFTLNTQNKAFGIEKDDDGAPTNIWVTNRHPLSMLDIRTLEWKQVPIYSSRTKRRQVLHVTRPLRPGQTRGVPYLTPVIETLKQLSRYTEAELQAAVVAGLFTVFIKSETEDDMNLNLPPTDTNVVSDDTQDKVKLGNGAVIDLAPNESIETANPGRPNAGFDPFVMSLCRYIGIALEIPVEVLIKHYTSSYSAARAAMQDLWSFVMVRRQWLVTNYCQPVYEWWMDEAVAIGRIQAPGYFDDPIIRQAYLKAKWTGPAKGMIQEQQEVDAAVVRMESGISTLEEETAQLTGGDWDENHRQLVKERKKRLKDGLIASMSEQLTASAKIKSDPNPPQQAGGPDTEDPEQGGKGNEGN